MKAQYLSTALVVLSLMSAAAPSAFAKQGEPGPCRQIKAACESAGFVKGMHKKNGKGLFKDCMEPVLSGQSVPGVSVTPDQIQACQAKKAERAAKKQKHG